MPFTAEERELKFRRFIKLKAQGMKRTRIMREIGKKLKNILTNYLFNLKIAEISDKTYATGFCDPSSRVITVNIC